MAENTARPIICPLSNPTSNCEALPEDVIRWTNGAAIVATGSPFAPVTHAGKTHPIGQGNNAFIFPGLGFGAIVAAAREITDAMVLAASYALARYTEERHPTLVYPPVSELREVSTHVARAVVKEAIAEGVSGIGNASEEEIARRVEAMKWRPEYLRIVRG
jgi:malate dehydrogenase (oxaloacetate-decarboxylating)